MKSPDIYSINGLKDLSEDELTEVVGGESLWYWIAYGIGSIGRGIVSMWETSQSDPRILESAMFY